MLQKWLFVVIAVITLAAGLGAKLWLDNTTEPAYMQAYPQARALPEFNLLDHKGKAFTPAQLRGKWTLAFTGYTFCPDICPVTLSNLASVYPQISGSAQPVQVLFISVDPARDSIERLHEYMQFFNPEFVAVTGEHKELFPLVRAMGMMYAIAESTDNPNYLVDHSASVVVINPQGQVIGRFKPEFSAGQVAVSDEQQILHDMPLIMTSYGS